MSEAAGGHGGGWLVTYCDMVTLLMACFIMVITFGNKEPEKYTRNLGSVVGGEGGSGAIGPTKKALDRASVVMRVSSPMGRIAEEGSEVPSLYADPTLEVTAEVLKRLDAPAVGTLADSYRMRVPMGLLFDGGEHLSSAAIHLLHVIAQNLQKLPYDIRFLVDDTQSVPQAIALCQQLAEHEGVHPGRLGVGARSSAEPWNPSVWVVFVRQPW
jgi:hypothetical protein